MQYQNVYVQFFIQAFILSKLCLNQSIPFKDFRRFHFCYSIVILNTYSEIFIRLRLEFCDTWISWIYFGFLKIFYPYFATLVLEIALKMAFVSADFRRCFPAVAPSFPPSAVLINHWKTVISSQQVHVSRSSTLD